MAIHGVAFPADYIQMGPEQRRDHRMPEAEAVGRLLAFQPGKDASRRIASLALRLAQRVRAPPPGPLSAESFLRHYGPSTRERVALMCVAEALLRRLFERDPRRRPARQPLGQALGAAPALRGAEARPSLF